MKETLSMTLLFLNSLGTGEVILIFLVVLILFGSKGIPDIARNLGRGMREIRNASNEIKRDIQKSALEMRKDLNVDDLEDITKLDQSSQQSSKKAEAPPKIESESENENESESDFDISSAEASSDKIEDSEDKDEDLDQEHPKNQSA